MQHLETAMIHWTRHFKAVLSCQDALQTSEDAEPLEEVQSYKSCVQVPREKVCDRVLDCTESNDDEVNCACGADKFKCGATGVCLPLAKRCNKLLECSAEGDLSD